MMTLFYIILYFVLGFIVATIKKAYDETYDYANVSLNGYYALLGMLWLPIAVLWVTTFSLGFIYELYKSKL